METGDLSRVIELEPVVVESSAYWLAVYRVDAGCLECWLKDLKHLFTFSHVDTYLF